MEFQGKVVVISGGASGIGRETAKRFLQQGATVIICDMNQTAIDETIASMPPTSGSITGFLVDISSEEDVRHTAGSILETVKSIDILINNAGITRDAFFQNMSEKQFDDVIHVNLKGTFVFTQAFLDSMISRKCGAIVNLSSVSGICGNMGQTNYAASKAGIIGMTKTWAKELGRYGIRVNAVAPGFIQTAMTATVSDKLVNQLLSVTPLQRLGQVEDVAKAILFLSSSNASYITGVVLPVDGGMNC